MLETLLQSFLQLMTLEHLGFMSLGVFLGLVVGVLPGLGGIVGLSLLMPFLFGMEQSTALAMLIGLVAVIPTSDTFASVLMGIPGSTASQATVLDGFPLAKQGQGARALSAAFSASLFGGLFGALVLTGFVVVARPVILSFGTPELLALTIFGLSMVGVLSGQSLAKGIAAASLGLAFGAIGAAPATSEYRMDFGWIYMMDGLPLVVVALGLFAVPEIVDLARSQSQIATRSPLGTGWMEGFRDTWRNKGLALRCSGIGAVVGAIPGLGGAVVDWIAYGHVVQTTRDKSQFGQGDIRGVIAPESANNAKEGGGLIPTLLFGIPGSGSMAVFLSGLVLLGVQPGPAMVSTNLHLTYTVVWSLALANVLGTLTCILVAPAIARLTTIRYALIAPFMIMVISFAAFQATRSLKDLVALLAIGTLSIFLRRFGWPRPAFLIGFVLASQVERYLYQAIQFSGWGFVTRPLVLAILAMTIISVWLGARSNPSAGTSRINTEGASARALGRDLAAQTLFAAVIAAALVFAFFDSIQLSFLGAVFPTTVAAVGLIATIAVVASLRRDPAASSANFDLEAAERENDIRGGAWTMLAWIAGFVALAALLGYVLAIGIFFISFLRTMGKASRPLTLCLTAGALGGLLILASALAVVMPAGLLQHYLNLPWPLR